MYQQTWFLPERDPYDKRETRCRIKSNPFCETTCPVVASLLHEFSHFVKLTGSVKTPTTLLHSPDPYARVRFCLATGRPNRGEDFFL